MTYECILGIPIPKCIPIHTGIHLYIGVHLYIPSCNMVYTYTILGIGAAIPKCCM